MPVDVPAPVPATRTKIDVPCEKDKIKRAITWIRKSLDITERTNMPEGIMRNIKPTLDVFGWERVPDVVGVALAGTNVSSQFSAVVPVDTARLVYSASVETTNNVLAFWLWIEHSVAASSILVGVMRPILTAAGTGLMRCGMDRTLIMAPGDRLVARANALVGVAETLAIRMRYVDLPIGEYVASL